MRKTNALLTDDYWVQLANAKNILFLRKIYFFYSTSIFRNDYPFFKEKKKKTLEREENACCNIPKASRTFPRTLPCKSSWNHGKIFSPSLINFPFQSTGEVGGCMQTTGK